MTDEGLLVGEAVTPHPPSLREGTLSRKGRGKDNHPAAIFSARWKAGRAAQASR